MLFDRSHFAVLAALATVAAPVILAYSTHVAAKPIETVEVARPPAVLFAELAPVRLPEIIITARRIAEVAEPRQAD